MSKYTVHHIEKSHSGVRRSKFFLYMPSILSLFFVFWYSLPSDPTELKTVVLNTEPANRLPVEQHLSDSRRDVPFGEFRCILRSYQPFMEVEVMWKTINTQWQSGWSFNGIPELKNATSKIMINCKQKVHLEKGVYSFFLYSRGFHSSVDIVGYNFGIGPHKVGNVWEVDVHAKGVMSKKVEIASHTTEILEFTAVKFEGYVQDDGFADIMLTWNKVEHTVSNLQAVTNLFFYNFPDPYHCKNFTVIPKSTWTLCGDQSNHAQYYEKCLVYSVGIQYIYDMDLYLGERGCEVFSFDCTEKYDRNLGENVYFYPYCLSDRDYVEAETGRIFKTFQTIQKEFNHQGRELTIFKIDCEGCEYQVFPNLSEQELDLIQTLQLEVHLGLNIYPEELDSIADTFRKIEKYFRPYHFNINRGKPPHVEVSQDWLDAGFLNHMCCVEYGFIKKGFEAIR